MSPVLNPTACTPIASYHPGEAQAPVQWNARVLRLSLGPMRVHVLFPPSTAPTRPESRTSALRMMALE